jgi:protein-S-isoprenylcysteine O-methyltransferase Ste14
MTLHMFLLASWATFMLCWFLSAGSTKPVDIKRDHKLITSGLYAHVCNPIYTGILLMDLGTVLFFGTWSALIGFLIILLAVHLKLSDEERILSRHFGAAYTSYKEQTKALIPFLW